MSFYVFDLDGTLADCEHRIHYIKSEPKDWPAFFAACGADKVIPHVREVMNALVCAGHHVEIWTGRSGEVEAETRAWLEANGIDSDRLTWMRKAGDHRSDEVVKREFLRLSEVNNMRPTAIFEDRGRVVSMWRRAGIPCFQVAEGEF